MNGIIISLLEVFIMLIPGVIFAKAKVLSEEQIHGVSAIVVNLTWPCLVIHSLQMEFSAEVLVNSGFVIAGMIFIMIAAWMLALPTKKLARLERAMYPLFVYMLIFSNTGFMGIPVAQALYGQEGVFYIALADSLSDLFVFTVGIMLMQRASGKTLETNYKEILSPGLGAIVIGILLFLGNVTLPSMIGAPVQAIGSATTPLAMLIVGFQLGRMELRTLFLEKGNYLLPAIKLLVLPLLAIGILKLLTDDITLFMKIIVLIAALPSATCSIIFAEKYQSDVDYVTKGVVLSTTLSVLTLPLIAIFLEV